MRFLDAEGPPAGTGQLILALDPVALGGPDTARRFAALAEAIAGQEGARLPGARWLALRRKAALEGLTVADGLLAEIKGL
jgi:(2R)-3-sulfolactate dehydrogenase (NADP+)